MGRLYCPRSMAGPHCAAFRQDRASQHHGNQDKRKENCSTCSTRGVKRVKQFHYRPSGIQDVEFPRFPDNRHVKVVSLTHRPHLPPRKYFCSVLDLIPVGTRFSASPDRPWGPPSLLYNGYRVFPGGKLRPGRAADHSPPSTATVMEE